MAKKENLRQRKKSGEVKKKNDAQETSREDTKVAIKTKTLEVGLPGDGETLKQVFLKHPLVKVAPFVFLPYIVYHAIYFLTLQYPGLISNATLGLVNLRPAMDASETRQVLILGPEFNENRFIAGGMASTLKLEIVHEAFDTKNYYCRDGSVSWFQMMRFAKPLFESSDSEESTVAAWKELCIDRNHSVIEMFHPKEYASSKCLSLQGWSNCLAQECLNVVKSLWGCEMDDKRECPQSFARTLHQVRHPMRTLESLSANICPYPKLRTSFLKVVAGFFPDIEWGNVTCLQAMGWYVVSYHKVLLNARKNGRVHGVFQIDNTSPCEVAALAGFSDEYSATYLPNIDRTFKLCRNDDVDTGNLDAMSPDLFVRMKEKNDGKQAAGLTDVSFEELQDNNLVEELQRLIPLLGYGENSGKEFL